MVPNTLSGIGSLSGLGSFTAVAPDSSFIARLGSAPGYQTPSDASNATFFVNPTTGSVAYGSPGTDYGALWGRFGANPPSVGWGLRRQFSASNLGGQVVKDVLLDSSDSLYVFGRSVRENVGYMAKYNSTGTEQVIRKIGNSFTWARFNTAKTSIFMLVNDNTLVKIGTDLVTIEWQKTISGLDASGAMGIDASDNIYFVSQGNSGSPTVNIVKIDSSANLVWEKTITVGGSSKLGTAKHAINQSGEIFITSYTESGTNIQPFVTKVNSSGDVVWARLIYKGDTNQQWPRNTYADGIGNVFVTNGTKIIKLKGTDGSLAFGRTFTATSAGFGLITPMATDNNGAFYIFARDTSQSRFWYTKFTADGKGTGVYTYGTYAVDSGVSSTASSSSSASASIVSSIATSSLTLSTGWQLSLANSQSGTSSSIVYDTIS